jgi:prolyl-tRNA editing enzyme YbaK/EbsC (Cys-tRNA(Pro) deacylase)
VVGNLEWVPVSERPDLVAAPVREPAEQVVGCRVAEIDPALADTAAFCARYEVPPEVSANCVVVAGRRGDVVTYAAVMVLATMQADVNGVVRKHLGARKASFARQHDVVSLTAMEYGGITPIGLPDGWPVLVDRSVLAAGDVVVGSGIRGSKLLLPARGLLTLPEAEELALSRSFG